MTETIRVIRDHNPCLLDDPQRARKWAVLQDILGEMGGVVVAYSGGVDSTLLLKAARDRLGPERVLAITATSPLHPQWEQEEASALAREIGVEHLLVESDELGDPDFVANSPDRCYFCKSDRFARLTDIARQRGFAHLVDGSNYDDLGDHRPGMRAAAELKVRSPLLEAGLTKADIRAISKVLGLPTWDKPSLACLASRFPYGRPITVEELRQVDQAETFLRRLGLGQLRVRHHRDTARIEVRPQDFPLVLAHREKIVARLRELGYVYVTLDLAGFRSGSMNEVL